MRFVYRYTLYLPGFADWMPLPKKRVSTLAAPTHRPRVARGLIRRRCVTRDRARHSARRTRYRPLARHTRGWFARLHVLARRPSPASEPPDPARSLARSPDRQRFGTRVSGAIEAGRVERAS